MADTPTAYATVQEYAVYAESDDERITARIMTRASELIDDYTRTAIYDTDDDGFPTDTDVETAFKEATCAQVEFWMAGDEEDDVLGAPDLVALSGLSAKGRTLAPRAARLLRNAGLYGGEPVIL